MDSIVADLSAEQRAELLKLLRTEKRETPTVKLTRSLTEVATTFSTISRKKFVDAAKAAWDSVHPSGSVWTPEQLNKRPYQIFQKTAIKRIMKDNPGFNSKQAMVLAIKEWNASKSKTVS